MKESIHTTRCGDIHYWVNGEAKSERPALVFLPGLTADHRLFDKQIEYFNTSYQVFVWDAPGHAASWPFSFDFNLFDKAHWLNEILEHEGIENFVIVGQSMGGYVGQAFDRLFPDKARGLVSIDSCPLQRQYYTIFEIALLKMMKPIFRCLTWKYVLKTGSEGVATSTYGKQLMRDMMMEYDGDYDRYVQLAGHGYRILAEAVEEKSQHELSCPVLIICGTEDKVGSCIRYDKAWHKKTGLPIQWIEGAGHNSNTDEPEVINNLIERFIKGAVKPLSLAMGSVNSNL